MKHKQNTFQSIELNAKKLLRNEFCLCFVNFLFFLLYHMHIKHLLFELNTLFYLPFPSLKAKATDILCDIYVFWMQLSIMMKLKKVVRFTDFTMQTHKTDNWYFCNRTTLSVFHWFLCLVILDQNKPSLNLLWISDGCVLCLSQWENAGISCYALVSAFDDLRRFDKGRQQGHKSLWEQ